MTESEANAVFIDNRDIRLWCQIGAIAGFAVVFGVWWPFFRDYSIWFMVGAYVLGVSPFAGFAYYRLQKHSQRQFQATQRTMSQIERLDDHQLWFVAPNDQSLHDTTPRDFYRQIVESLRTAKKPAILLDKVVASRRVVTIYQGARSEYSPGFQFVLRSLVESGAHREWGRDGRWFLGADVMPVDSAEFDDEIGSLFARHGRQDVAREIGNQRLDSAIRIANDRAGIGLFAILEDLYIGACYHKV